MGSGFFVGSKSERGASASRALEGQYALGYWVWLSSKTRALFCRIKDALKDAIWRFRNSRAISQFMGKFDAFVLLNEQKELDADKQRIVLRELESLLRGKAGDSVQRVSYLLAKIVKSIPYGKEERAEAGVKAFDKLYGKYRKNINSKNLVLVERDVLSRLRKEDRSRVEGVFTNHNSIFIGANTVFPEAFLELARLVVANGHFDACAWQKLEVNEQEQWERLQAFLREKSYNNADLTPCFLAKIAAEFISSDVTSALPPEEVKSRIKVLGKLCREYQEAGTHRRKLAFLSVVDTFILRQLEEEERAKVEETLRHYSSVFESHKVFWEGFNKFIWLRCILLRSVVSHGDASRYLEMLKKLLQGEIDNNIDYAPFFAKIAQFALANERPGLNSLWEAEVIRKVFGELCEKHRQLNGIFQILKG